MTILITSRLKDSHSLAVKNAITELGFFAEIIDTAAESTYINLRPGFEEVVIEAVLSSKFNDFEKIWFRRPIKRLEANASMSEIEISAHTTCVLDALSQRARFLVNRLDLAIGFESKLRCQVAAAKAGFRTPRTLMSANHLEIVSFFNEVDGQMVYKPHRQHASNSRRSFIGTTKISSPMLGNTSALEEAPGIYQEYLKIDYEVRVLVVGRSAIAARIDNHSRFVDSRIMIGSQNAVTQFKLPHEIEEKCLELVRGNDLVSASIDVAVMAGGDYVFLDLNPSGQFLWVERYCPEVPVLDVFSRFLVSGDPDFMYRGASEHERVTLRHCACE